MRSAGFEPALASKRNRFQVYSVYHFRHDRRPRAHYTGLLLSCNYPSRRLLC